MFSNRPTLRRKPSTASDPKVCVLQLNIVVAPSWLEVVWLRPRQSFYYPSTENPVFRAGNRQHKERIVAWIQLTHQRVQSRGVQHAGRQNKVLRAVDTRRYPRVENRVWSDQEDHEERGSKDRAASTCGPHSDSFNDTGRRRRSNCSTNNFQTPCRSKSKRPFRALPLIPKNQQLRLQWCQARSMWNVTDWQKVVFSDESRFVLGTNDNRVRLWRRPAYDSRSTLIVMRGSLTGQRYVDDILRPHNLSWPAHSPDLSPAEHVWDQLKRQMPSCHSVHDLEMAVQDLWAHLPQDNIRCLINSMVDRVAACIAASNALLKLPSICVVAHPVSV
ncbi:transposable element Tcb2 transposase [Trichonephila clavipes]|nr:transposable element Tcb2 transposase [Trichonephila clavipes]